MPVATAFHALCTNKERKSYFDVNIQGVKRTAPKNEGTVILITQRLQLPLPLTICRSCITVLRGIVDLLKKKLGDSGSGLGSRCKQNRYITKNVQFITVFKWTLIKEIQFFQVGW